MKRSWVKGLGYGCAVLSFGLSYELSAMEFFSPQVRSFKEYMANYLITESEHGRELALNNYPSLDLLLGSFYCRKHPLESWAALATVEKVFTVLNEEQSIIDEQLPPFPWRLKALIPLAMGKLIAVNKRGIFYLLDKDGRILCKQFLHRRAFSKLPQMLTFFILNSAHTYGISGTNEGDVAIWSIPTGAFVKKFEHAASITCAALSTSEKKLVSGSSEGELYLWDFETGDFLGKKKCGNSPLLSLTFLDDERFVVVGEKNRMRIINLETQECVRKVKLEQRNIGALLNSDPSGFILSADVCSNTIDLGSLLPESAQVATYCTSEKNTTLSALVVDPLKSFCLTAGYGGEDFVVKKLYSLCLWRLPSASDKSHKGSPEQLTLLHKILLPFDISALAVNHDLQEIIYGDDNGSLGKIRTSYLTSLLTFKQARLVIDLVKKVMRGDDPDLTEEEKIIFLGLVTPVKKALKNFFEKSQVNLKTKQWLDLLDFPG